MGLSGTFLNALDNTTVTGTLSFVEPTTVYSKAGYVSKVEWVFTPDAAYGAGALQARGSISSIYVEKVPQTVVTDPSTVVFPNNTNIPSIVVKSNPNAPAVVLSKLGTPQIKKLKKAKNKVTVTWKKAIANCTGYQIYVSTKKASGFKVKTTVKKQGAKSGVLKKLKKKKTYYVKVRAYRTVGSVRLYSKFSKVKKIKL